MTQFTSTAQNQVKDFHEAFNHPISYKPNPLDLDRAVNRSIWTGEEIVEFIHASSSNLEEFDSAYSSFIEGLDIAFLKSAKVEFPKDNTERVIAQADALTDTSYFINGSFVEIGVDAQPVFDIVQGANMSKLFTREDGTKYAKYREDGKILKSESFYSPEPLIEKEIVRQIKFDVK